MTATTMYETLASLLGLPVCAIPLSFCDIKRPYLLERAGIGADGTAMIFAIPYLVTSDVSDSTRNLSLYAVPRDYHAYVDGLKEEILPRLSAAFPEYRFAMFADHSPIAEVRAAAMAGLGVLGDNGLLLTPDYGSFVFLCEVCTDADYQTVMGVPPSDRWEIKRCERCGACRAACPMCQEGTECLSALTQKKGSLTEAEIASLRAHGLVWGCDACQLACPHNRTMIEAGRDTNVPFFREGRITAVTAQDISDMNDDSFASRAFSWRGRAVILRNLQLKEEAP